MSIADNPRLNVWVNADDEARPGSPTVDGISSAMVARKRRLACRRAPTRLNSCTWCLRPPRRNDAPSMNRLLVTIAPATDAFTSMY